MTTIDITKRWTAMFSERHHRNSRRLQKKTFTPGNSQLKANGEAMRWNISSIRKMLLSGLATLNCFFCLVRLMVRDMTLSLVCLYLISSRKGFWTLKRSNGVIYTRGFLALGICTHNALTIHFVKTSDDVFHQKFEDQAYGNRMLFITHHVDIILHSLHIHFMHCMESF